jgi:hypothetical protein
MRAKVCLAVFSVLLLVTATSSAQDQKQSIPGYRPDYRISNHHAITRSLQKKRSRGHREWRPDG